MMFRRILFPVISALFFACVLSCSWGARDKDDDSAAVFEDDTESVDDTAPAADDTIAEPPHVSHPLPVVPSNGLPPEVVLLPANNNLDVTWYDDRAYLAFRTAPSHFASAEARIYVVSSDDQETWDFEAVFQENRDMREPRLLAWDGRLFLYFAVLGANPLDFEPGGMMVTEYNGPGDWAAPELFYGEGFIPWRTKVIDGVPYMLTYIGGENLYDFTGEPVKVHWLTSGDGHSWIPVVPEQPVVLEGGCSETDFVFQDDGTLIAVCRNEAGDETGWGSKICRAEADDLGSWQCNADPKKYDSPLLFRHEDGIYLIGRRNVTPSGNFDLGLNGLSQEMRAILYSAYYWFFPKRCSLWRIDPEALTASFVQDFPSRGDTCFPGLLDYGDGSYEVYNYTSPLDGPDVYWLQGQLGFTMIYRTTLDFEYWNHRGRP
jgi:hypothetical protein